VDRHLFDLLLWKVEVPDCEVGGVTCGLRIGPDNLRHSIDEVKLGAILCDGEMVVELSHLELREGIEGEVCFLVVGLGQGGWWRWWLLQGLDGGDGGADVSTYLGYEPQLELNNHGGIHDLVWFVWCMTVEWI
jgi:hypothetical protein